VSAFNLPQPRRRVTEPFENGVAEFEQDGVRVIVAIGELDIASSPALDRVLALDRAGPLVVDLSLCSFIDSSGLQTLLRRAGRPSLGLAVVCVPGDPASLLIDMTGVGTVKGSLRVFATREDAISALTGDAHRPARRPGQSRGEPGGSIVPHRAPGDSRRKPRPTAEPLRRQATGDGRS